MPNFLKKNITLPIVCFTLLFVSSAQGGEKSITIDTPNLCVAVDRVKDDNVYLKSTKKDCEDFAGKTGVLVGENVETVNIYVDGTLWKNQEAKGFDTDVFKDIKERSDKNFGSMAMPQNAHEKEAAAKANDLFKLYQSEQIQSKISKQTEELKKNVFAKELSDFYKDENLENKVQEGKLAPDERIYIFVSSSMPLSTLRGYAKAVDKLKDPHVIMVMRGFVGGLAKAKPMLEFVSSVIVKTASCDNKKEKCAAYTANLQVDSLLFSKYGVTTVPTVVYATGVQVVDVGASEGKDENAKVANYFSVNGDASLEYILGHIARESKSKSLEGVLASLEKGYY